MQAVKSVNSTTLWTNLHLLLCAAAYPLWIGALTRHHGRESSFARALGQDVKSKISLAMYLLGIGLTTVNPWLGFGTFACVALIWFAPDRRMHQAIDGHER